MATTTAPAITTIAQAREIGLRELAASPEWVVGLHYAVQLGSLTLPVRVDRDGQVWDAR